MSTEREQIIARARELDAATLDAEACAAGPGKFEGANDLELTVAVYIIAGHGFQDEQAGSVEYGLNGQRVGSYVLWEDDRGFVTLCSYKTERAAEQALAVEAEAQEGNCCDA